MAVRPALAMVVAAADFCFFSKEGSSVDADSGTGISE